MEQTGGAVSVVPPRSGCPAQGPAILNIALGVCAVVVAAFRQPMWSGIAYVLVLVGGAVLVAFQRHLSLRASRPSAMDRYANPWRRGSAPMSVVERVAIVCMLVAALLNAIIVAFEIGRWAWAQ